VTSPTFSRVGKRSTVKDWFARYAITLDSSAVHCLSNEMGKVSSGDVVVGAACISLATLAAVIRVNVDRKLEGAVRGICGDATYIDCPVLVQDRPPPW